MSAQKYRISVVSGQKANVKYLCVTRDFYISPIHLDSEKNKTSIEKSLLQLYAENRDELHFFHSVFSFEKSLSQISYEEQMELLHDENDILQITFIIGILEGKYYRIFGIVGLDDGRLFLGEDIDRLSIVNGNRLFVIPGRIKRNLWERIVSISNQRTFFVGGDREGAWGINEFIKAIKNLPQRRELDLYINEQSSIRLQNFGLFAVWCGWAGRVEVAGG